MAKKRPRIGIRKPAAAPDADAAQRFVKGGKSGSLRAPPGQRVYGRADGTELARFTAYMPPELKKRFDMWCLDKNKSGSDVITSLVRKFLDDEVKSK